MVGVVLYSLRGLLDHCFLSFSKEKEKEKKNFKEGLSFRGFKCDPCGLNFNRLTIPTGSAETG